MLRLAPAMRPAHQSRGWWRIAAAVTALVLLVAPTGTAAAQQWTITPLNELPTEIVMTGTGAGQRVQGYIAPKGDTGFDPTAGYPAGKPAGFENLDLGFAGIITARPASGTTTIRTYCIDVRTPTSSGNGYVPGEWGEAQVPLVGYIAQILNLYYPNSGAPAAAANDNQRAAAVQAAIWFFSDKYVLRSTDAAYPLTKAIVEDVLARGPVATPQPPSLQIIAPSEPSGVVGSLIGPFTIQTTSPATVSAAGGQLFADAAGTLPVTNPVADGTRVWVRSSSVGPVTVSASAQATVPSGNVYLYDGKRPGVTAAQKLILAQTAVLNASTTASALFFDTGTLVVRKAILGEGAGLQADIVLGVECGGVTLEDVVIPAGAAGGSYSTLVGPVKTPTSCTVTEKSDGANAQVSVSASGSVTVELPENATPGDEVPALIVDTMTPNPGELVVTKTITGTGNDQRGDIVIDVVCDEGTTRSFTIPPGQLAPAGGFTVPNLPAGTRCTVTEPQTGGNAQVSNEVVIAPDTGTATIPPGGSATVALTNSLALNPGDLVVTKTITGAGVAARGDIVLAVSCDNGTTETITIPAGQEPDPNGYSVAGLPAGTRCTVTESATGGNQAVSNTIEITPEGPVQIPAGGTGTVEVTNTFAENPGSLLVTKTITGPQNALALRDPVVIDVVCSNGQTESFTIPAGAQPAEGYLVEGLPARTTCTITESANGSNTAVTSTVEISADEVTIGAGAQSTVTVTNTYTLNPASLTVFKSIVGAGELRGDVSLLVECSDGSSLPIEIPAGQPADPAGYSLDGIAGDATCTVTELSDGANQQVNVIVSGLVTDLVLTPGTASEVTVTDDYRPRPGILAVRKTISGTGQDLRGDLTITVSCTAPDREPPIVVEDTWVIPAGTEDPTLRLYELPAGAECTVTETVDGSNGQTSVATDYLLNGEATSGPAEGVVPPGGIVGVDVLNDYTLNPGSLTVSKAVTGAAAGRQGEIVIDVKCTTAQDSTLKPQEVEAQLVIPAGTTNPDPLVVTGIPAGLVCTITETADGATAEVGVTTVAPGPTTIAPGGAAAATVTNTYLDIPEVPEVPEVPGGELPDTGAGAAQQTAALGLWLLATGVLLVLAARRRLLG
jgi:hypothetical protein